MTFFSNFFLQTTHFLVGHVFCNVGAILDGKHREFNRKGVRKLDLRGQRFSKFQCFANSPKMMSSRIDTIVFFLRVVHYK